MQRGAAPGGDLSPPNLLEVSCIPDIQRTTCDNLKVTNASTNVSEGTKDVTKGSRTASILLASYVIEITAMITATFFRIIPQNFPSLPLDIYLFKTTDSSDHNYFEISPISLGIYLSIFIIPFLIVTSISLAWVLRGQDFSGKLVARLVCWLLHILQSSLIWRYLKIQIAFDPGDLSELGMLRFVQVYIHNLPFLVMHLIVSLSFSHAFSLSFSLAFVMLLSTAATIVISSETLQLSQMPNVASPTVVQLCQQHINKKNAKTNNKVNFIMGATSLCILWSRVISMAALFCLHAIWAIGLIIAHWLAAIIWLGFQEKISLSSCKSFKQIIRRIFLGYLLLWDWYIFEDKQEASEHNACSQPRIPTIYYIIVSLQNIASVCVWYVTKRITQTSILYTAVLVSVVISQACGLLLLSLSYMCFSSSFLCSKKLAMSRKPSLVKCAKKVSTSDITTDLNIHKDATLVLESPPYGEFTELAEKDLTQFCSTSICSKEIEQSNKIRLEDEKCTLKEKNQLDTKEKKFTLSLSPRLLSKHQCSVYNCSNDIQNTFKSERSSTDYGSFNSRNTNTLPGSGSMVPDYEVIQRHPGSFSDSFSSLSCGTVSKVVTSTPKGNLGNQFHSFNNKKLKHLKACQNSCCRDKIRERIASQCAEVEEEQNDDIINDEEQLSLASLDKNVSPPSVAVVRDSQRLQVVCTKCLNAHDPLLTRCKTQINSSAASYIYSCKANYDESDPGSSTAYPSDTELTTTVDSLSSISAESHSTYTTWPVGRNQGLAKLLAKEKNGNDYVAAWLQHQETRGTTQQQRHVSFQSPQKKYKNELSNQNQSMIKCSKISKRHKFKLKSPTVFQDVETIV